MTRKKILLIGRGPGVATLEAALRERGRAAISAEDVPQAMALVRAHPPDAVVVAGSPRSDDMALLRMHGALARVPLIVSAELSVDAAIGLLNHGVVRVVPPSAGVQALEAVLNAPLVEKTFTRGLAQLALMNATAQLRLLLDHEQLGMAYVEGRRITGAAAGDLVGGSALQALVGNATPGTRLGIAQVPPPDFGAVVASPLDDNSVDERTPLLTPAPSSGEGAPALPPPSVLIVEDDPDLQRLYSIVLQKRGFRVTTANDGADGYEKARALRPDLVLSDIMMPRLNGWDLLALLRNDAHLREVRVLLLSHHRDLVGRLANVDAGADDYLEKTLNADEIVRRIVESLRPRREALVTFLHGGPVHGRVRDLGAGFLLRALSQAQRTGVLDVSDGWSRFRVAFEDGRLLDVAAQAGETVLHRNDALRTLLLVDDADFAFTDHPRTGSPGVAVADAVAAVAEELNALLERTRTNAMSTGQPLRVHAPLYALYMTTCPDAARPIAEGIARGETPIGVLQRTQAPTILVDYVLRDMFRKGVLSA